MKIGVFAVLLANKSLEEALKYLSGAGVQAIELGTGGYPGDALLKPDKLLTDEKGIKALKELLQKYNIEISALSCHGNPVHPQKDVADRFDEIFGNTVLLAERLGISRVVTFSGCPGGGKGAKYPNWVTCPWPDEFLKILDYQWNEVLIPYWKKAVAFSKAHGVDKICLEMHPGFCVYNTETLLKLRNAVGNAIGANFDPSHLFWQGIDPVASIRKLGPAIFHFHAKDTKIDKMNTAINGVMDIKPGSDVINRSWIFRSVGYGHDAQLWKDIISNLRMVGYDGAISIEQEDSLMSVNEGLLKSIRFLKDVMTFESRETSQIVF